MRQPAGTYTEADLERIIARDFAQDSISRGQSVVVALWEGIHYKACTTEAKQKAIESDWKQLQAWLNRKERAPR